MNTALLNSLISLDTQVKEKIKPYKYERFLVDKITNQRPFKLILGLRGVGKTTILIQHALKNNAFYINLDNLALKSVNLLEVLNYYYDELGFENFCLDEIQSLENWELQLKNIFEVTNYNLTISGSSLINILEKTIDLSRRIITYEIPPFSFREYLLFKKNIKIDTISYEDLFNKKKRNMHLSSIVKYTKYFDEYNNYGAYPFSIKNKEIVEAFSNILNKTLYVDFTRIKNTNEETLQHALKIVKYISSGTEEVSINTLSQTSGISKNKIHSIMDLLERSMLIIRIEPKAIGKNLLKKHIKYNMLTPIRSLTNEIYGLQTQIGNIREDFFITSLFYHRKDLFYIVGNSKNPDFYLDGNIFEIGGKSKTNKQIKGIKNSYLVKDSTELSKDNEIPLILFGFLY